MEAGECGRTHGTYFITCRLEVVTVAGLLWLLWCVFGGAEFFLVFQVTTFKFVHEYTTDGWERPKQQSAPTR